MKRFCCIIALYLLFATQAEGSTAKAMATVRVVDEQGIPIANAEVGVSFTLPKTWNPWDGIKFATVEGKTDKNGIFTASSKTLSEVSAAAEKDGYYVSTMSYRFDKQESGKWQPWNPTIELVLRKKVDPIPLKAKSHHYFTMPALTAGYDLMEGDWVSPHGAGQTADFVFSVSREYRSNLDFSYMFTLEMGNENDGFSVIPASDMQPQSKLRSPRQASAKDKYIENSIVIRHICAPGKSRKEILPKGGDNFMFRVRTERDKTGQIEKALYGKLIGPVECSLHYVDTAKVTFTYYLNPAINDRNLEFDPKQNLFKNLESMQEVREP